MKRALALLLAGLALTGCTTDAPEHAAPTSSPSRTSGAGVESSEHSLVAPGFRHDCDLVVRMADDDGVYHEVGPEDFPGKQIGVADSWCAATGPNGQAEYFPPEEATSPIPVWSIPGEDRAAMIAVGWPHEGYLAMQPVPGLIID